MIISPDTNGWSYDDSTGNWKLVYADKLIVIYEQTDESIGTQTTLFVGTQEECKTKIVELGLLLTADAPEDEPAE